LMRQGKYAEAEPEFRQAVADFDSLGNAQVRGGEARRRLGEVLAKLNRLDEAEVELLAAERMLAEAQNVPAELRRTSISALVEFYSDREKTQAGNGFDQKAKQWQAKLSAIPSGVEASSSVDDAALRQQSNATGP